MYDLFLDSEFSRFCQSLSYYLLNICNEYKPTIQNPIVYYKECTLIQNNQSNHNDTGFAEILRTI